MQECTINRFIQNGIDFEPSGDSRLFVRDTIIRNCRTGAPPTAGVGILVKPTSTGRANASIDNVRLDSNFFGMRVESVVGSGNPVLATIRNSVVSGNFQGGLLSNAPGALVTFDIDSCNVSNNNGAADTRAIRSILANSTVRLNNNMVTGNDTGLSPETSGKIATFGNNHIAGNTANGAPTEAVTPSL